MKVLVVNTSLNGTASEMDMLLIPFIKGATESGAEVECVNTSNLIINPCRACTDDASFESKGICDCQDDMQKLYPKFRESEVWVFASPLTSKKTSDKLFNILDRLEPLFENSFDAILSKKNEFKGRIAFLSTSSSYNKDCFNEFEKEFKNFSRLYSKEFAGSLLRPHSWAMISLNELGIRVNDILDAAYEAGKQIVKTGKISHSIAKVVSRTLVPDDITYIS